MPRINWMSISTLCILIGGATLLTTLSQKTTQASFCVSQPEDLAQLFPQSVGQIKEFEARAINVIDQTLAKILAVSAQDRTFANTVRVLDLADLELSPIHGGLSAIHHLSPNAEMRDAAQAAILKISNYQTEKLGLNKQLYQAFQDYVTSGMPREQLRPDQTYLIQETMAGFKRSGLELPDQQLEQVRQLITELNDLGLKFDANIAQDGRTVTVGKDGLAGLSADFIAGLKQDQDGNYVLGVDYPTVFMVLDHCASTTTRKSVWTAFNNRAYPQNTPVLEAIVAKRDQLAKLLGFKNYTELDLDNQMVKSPDRAKAFINDVIQAATPKALQEIAELKQHLPDSVQLVDGQIQPWDIRFLRSYYKAQKLNFDERQVAEYFPLEHTINKLLWVYEQFLSLKFVQLPTIAGLWSDEARTIAVYQAQTNQLIGYLIIDLFPRPNKYSHACMFSVVPAVKPAPDVPACPAVAIVIANFPRPSADKPALLLYNDVRTFFHEFGHALHGLLGQTALASFAGTNVKRDFVELPSQMLEDWLKDGEILAQITEHYQTGAALPKELIDQILELEQLDAGDQTLRQLGFAKVSLEMFEAASHPDLVNFDEKIGRQVRPYIAVTPDAHLVVSFGHLIGYGAKYYGYMWSKVFAKDMFAHIKAHGLLNPAIGQEYIDKVIGQGGQKDPNELLKDFLGREPNQAAFKADLGF